MSENEFRKPELIKGQVRHHLKLVPKETLGFRLLKTCVLRSIINSNNRSELALASLLQRSLQQQNFRLMQKNPKEKLAITYRLNCRPVGFFARPWTRVCNRARLCPWCFVRRCLSPTYQALMSVPKDIRANSRVIGWRRRVPLTNTFPFFRCGYGPHQWCNAKASVQIAVPWFSLEDNSLICYHFGIQIVPFDCPFRAALTRKVIDPALEIVDRPRAFSNDIVSVISSTTLLPWATLYQPEQFEQFQKLFEFFEDSSARLLRVQSYRP